LLLHVWIFKSRYLGRYLLSFLVILPFFLLTNGILTGSAIPEQVVWYDNDENLGIRVGTIPLEDFVFGFLLLLSVVTVYEWLLAKKKKAEVTSQSRLPYRRLL
jgi:lycopene cyclase domain-containing protein